MDVERIFRGYSSNPATIASIKIASLVDFSTPSENLKNSMRCLPDNHSKISTIPTRADLWQWLPLRNTSILKDPVSKSKLHYSPTIPNLPGAITGHDYHLLSFLEFLPNRRARLCRSNRADADEALKRTTAETAKNAPTTIMIPIFDFPLFFVLKYHSSFATLLLVAMQVTS